MKRTELIDKYSKLLRLQNYSAKTEKLYFQYINLFFDYISTCKITEINQKVLLDCFDNIKQIK